MHGFLHARAKNRPLCEGHWHFHDTPATRGEICYALEGPGTSDLRIRVGIDSSPPGVNPPLDTPGPSEQSTEYHYHVSSTRLTMTSKPMH